MDLAFVLKILTISIVFFMELVQSTESNHWATKITDALKQRDAFVPPMKNLQEKITTENLLTIIPLLEGVTPKLQAFDNISDVSASIKSNEPVVSELFNLLQKEPIVKDLYPNTKYATDYEKDGLGYILGQVKNHNDVCCLFQAILQPSRLPAEPKEITLPLKDMCLRMAKKQSNRNDNPSLDKVCLNVNTCVPSPEGSDVEDACTEDNKCDVRKALPMFGALFWYEVSDYIANFLCNINKASREAQLEKIENDSSHITAYMATLGWDLFFRDAVSRRAYSDLNTAMELLDARKELIKYTRVACEELQSDDMCTVQDIWQQYIMLGRVQEGELSTGPTRDLRINSDLNHQRLMSQHVDARRHIQLLGEITSLDENLKTSVEGISTYFGTLAEFDRRIGEADVAYVVDQLKKFNTKSEKVQEKLIDDTGKLMAAVVTTLALQLISEITRLASVIAENSNPIKVMLTGVDVDAIYERTTAVVQAAQGVARGAALAKASIDLGRSSGELARDFQKNQQQLTSLKATVESILADKAGDIDKYSKRFIDEYGSYTPQVSRSQLEANSALWSAYKDSACDVLFGSDGPDVEIPIGKGVAGGLLMCEKLEGTLAEFFTLREDIFDFQFELVEALTRVVRGKIAQGLASSITTANEPLHSSQLMRGFFMLQYRIQSDGFVYCNVLQYKRHGKRLEQCPETGFIDYDNLDKLSAFENKISYHEENRIVDIPTRAAFPGDMGYVNLQALADGKSVSFKLPQNRTWLQDNKWVLCNEVIAPLVKSFEVYLPLKTYENVGGRHTITTVTLTNPEGSMVAYQDGVRYYLPENRGIYRTTYEEGYTACSSGESDNPYSLCNNLPKLCITSTQDATPTLRPTILSTWNIKYTKTSGSQVLHWQAPNSSTPFYLKASVKLQHIVDPKITCPDRSRRLRRRANRCCPEGKYLRRWINFCVDCPSDSTSHLRGYYCERSESAGQHHTSHAL